MPISPHSSNAREPDLALPESEVLTVSSLNSLARSLLESNFPAVLVEGEISNLAMPASGHWYFTLKDAHSQIRCAMFRNRNLRARFKPDNGMQILVKGKLSIYEGRGDYQLILDEMEEAGDGALRRAFEQLKNKLSEEGLFSPEQKQAISDHYRHIGVITSATGAAVRDILSVLGRRFPATRVTLFPVAVQGSDAPGEIVLAIEKANQLAQSLNLEILILGRGGGSLEDLQAFNEESVARAIFASILPVVSAVGHEIDFTIADFVADMRAPTPSAAAELISPDQEEYRLLFVGYLQQFEAIAKQTLTQHGQRLVWLQKRLKHPGRRLQEHAQTLDIMDRRLTRALNQRLAQQRVKLKDLSRSLRSHSPRHKISQVKASQERIETRLKRAVRHQLQKQGEYLGQLVRNLSGLSPLNTLARGYSITFDKNDKIIRNSDDVELDSSIMTRLGEGEIVSKVTMVKSVGDD